eukprot:g30813.t1
MPNIGGSQHDEAKRDGEEQETCHFAIRYLRIFVVIINPEPYAGLAGCNDVSDGHGIEKQNEEEREKWGKDTVQPVGSLPRGR